MWCIMTSGEEPSVIQGCLIQCNSRGGRRGVMWSQPLGCCPRATLLGGPMTFTKCEAELRYLFWESPLPDLGCNIHRTHYIWNLYPTLYNIFGESSSIQTHSYNWANTVLHEIAKIYWNKSKFAYIKLIRKIFKKKKLLKNLTLLRIRDIKLLKKNSEEKRGDGIWKKRNSDTFCKGIWFFFPKRKEARWGDFDKTTHSHLLQRKTFTLQRH